MPIDIDVSAEDTMREERITRTGNRTPKAQKGAQPREHLYVMLNSDDLIKVGRSSDPVKRRRQLETASGKSVRLIFVLEGAGERELKLHWALRKHRTTGEWFHRNSHSVSVLNYCLKTVLDFSPPITQDMPRAPQRPREPDFPYETTAERRAYREKRTADFIASVKEGYRRRDAGLVTGYLTPRGAANDP